MGTPLAKLPPRGAESEMNRMKHVWWIVLGSMLGCDLEDTGVEDELVEEDDAPRSGGGGGSGTGWGCRTCGFSNSPMLGGFALDQFVVGAAPVPQGGLRLAGIVDPYGTPVDVAVVNNAFVADKSGVQVSGAALQGWALRFEDENAQTLDVEIFDYSEQPSWVDDSPVATYTLTYRDAGGDVDLNVCPGMDPDLTSITVLSGERYDGTTKTVVPNSSEWVTLACRGHALAKMRMLGYAPKDQFGSTPKQRQATLKMLTADYCGTGHSFTAIGQPIDWADVRGRFPLVTNDPSRLEARWTEKGATCLDTPRLVSRNEVKALCALPKCYGDFSMAGVTWITTLQ